MKTEKVGKRVENLHDKTEFIIHISNLKESLSWISFEENSKSHYIYSKTRG